jgi:hemerythrin-like domain-containing protein
MERRRNIQTCRDHHAILRELINRIASKPRAFDAPRAREDLGRLQTVLLRHLHFEDDHLYPDLEETERPDVSQKARRYKREMGDLRHRFEAFLERWNEATIAGEPVRFADEWHALRQALISRIDAEDGDLYEIAEQLVDEEVR